MRRIFNSVRSEMFVEKEKKPHPSPPRKRGGSKLLKNTSSVLQGGDLR
jgi:hypothetical protein